MKGRKEQSHFVVRGGQGWRQRGLCPVDVHVNLKECRASVISHWVGSPRWDSISGTWDHDPADTQPTEPHRCPENRANFKQGVSSWVKWSCKRWGAKSGTGTSESRSGAKMPTGDPRESKVSGLAEESLVSLWAPPVYFQLVTGAGGCVSHVDLRSL